VHVARQLPMLGAMRLQAIVPAFVLSSLATLVATGLWGSTILVPFTLGEIGGALVTILLLWSSKTVRQPVHSEPKPAATGPRTKSYAPSESLTRLRRAPKCEGQVSPYFPGVRAWLYVSCPPLRRSMRQHVHSRVVEPLVEVLPIRFAATDSASKARALLPEPISGISARSRWA